MGLPSVSPGCLTMWVCREIDVSGYPGFHTWLRVNFSGQNEAGSNANESLEDEGPIVYGGGATGRASLHLFGARRFLGIITNAGIR